MLTMKYDLKTYRKDYLDDHATIEANERNRWNVIVRPDNEQLKTNLKKQFSNPSFDPETVLYAFKDDKMVGVVTSTIHKEGTVTKGDLSIPFVSEGYEDARDLLLKRIMEILKSKGATSVRTLVSEYWGETIPVAKRNGFKFEKDFVIQSQKRFDEINKKKLVEIRSAQNFDYQEHANYLAELLMKQYSVSREEAFKVVDRFKDWEFGSTKSHSGVPQRLVAHGLMIDKGEVIGRYLGLQQDISGEKTTDLTIHAKDNNKEILEELLAAGIKESKTNGMEILHIGLLEPTQEVIDFYTSYGLVFRTAAAYYIKEESV